MPNLLCQLASKSKTTPNSNFYLHIFLICRGCVGKQQILLSMYSKQKRSLSFTEKFPRSRPLITYLRPSGLAGSKKRFQLSDTDKLARLLLLPAFYLLSLTQRGFLSLFLVFSWSPRLYIFSFLWMDKSTNYRRMMAKSLILCSPNSLKAIGRVFQRAVLSKGANSRSAP